MRATIAVLPGDGVGPEVVDEAIAVLRTLEERVEGEVHFDLEYGLLGGSAYEEAGVPLPEETLKMCREAHAVLMGAVGGPKWDNLSAEVRPEAALLGLRKALGLFCNLRPALMFAGMEQASSLKPEVVNGVDLLVVRELTGGIYFGEKRREETEDGLYASDQLIYYDWEIERIVRRAYDLAMVRKKRITSVDKANVLESSRLWREIVMHVAKDYPEVETQHLLVDSCAMQLVANPTSFDVIVTENMFGDILSDEASMLTGSIGMLPSASLAEGRFGLYEPVHGSAPDIAGHGVANPVATILSAAMMLRYSFGMLREAEAVEKAVQKTLAQGLRTRDIAREGEVPVGTKEMGAAICKNLFKG